MADKKLRQELLEARANVERQLSILRTGRRTFDEPKPIPLALKLAATLKEIDDSLAQLGDDDA
jgi:hypothetical protein